MKPASPEDPPNDYLWDRTGEKDPEVARLEDLLAPLAYSAAGAGARPGGEVVALRRRARPLRLWTFRLALAAAVALAVGVPALVRTLGPSGWSVSSLSASAATSLLRPGETLDVGEEGALLTVGTVGELEVRPRSRVQLLSSRAHDQRLSLVRGELTARIWAPPGVFRVETAMATAVDLGCVYRLAVDEAGNGELEVLSGWVSFETRGRESFVPAGARADSRAGIGPGTPHRTTAPAQLREALFALDFGPTARDGEQLATVLRLSTGEDAFTLWHLLSRVPRADRETVARRLESFVPLPKGVDREAVLAGNRAAQLRWWDELGLGNATWWRLWREGRGPLGG